ncbi:PREDICTED: fatty-acid amide hydrolase 1-like [Branchiostoma belcheri]|uniref:Fatty-acid amide hydrolase 1 n=1 Tax=Branchiostoma belcheri TaxID=7741 RepID=A0A6P5AV22_BRABE|nr:PREDICTED: fatty-acid amide hydrolase 1-like [Branchiostoma belcheri]
MDRVYNLIVDSVNTSVVTYTAVSAGVLSCYVGLKVYRRQQVKKKALKKREESRKALQDVQRSVVTDDGTTAAKRREILSLPLPQLSQQLRDGQLSAVQVLQAFQEKATAVNDKINCLTEPVPDALVRAQNVDVADQPLGLLHGVPVSIKENYNIKGMATTMGVTKHLDTPADEDAVIVQVLKKQGAVPFVKTNIPQTLLSISCSNPVFGNTLNPVDPTRSPGGSSGGEAALIKGGGSLLGFGSDIGGSVRTPALFCGICGLKPTAKRISGRGLMKGSPGVQGVISTPGVMARDVDSLALGMKALLVPDMFQLDPQVIPVPFRQEIYEDKKPMRIGYFTTLQSCPPTPSMGRAVIMAKEALEKAGHTLVPFDPPDDLRAIVDLVTRLITADNGRTFSTMWLKDEIIDEYLKGQIHLWTMPHYLRKIQAFLLKPFWPRIAKVLSHRLIGSVYDLWQRMAEREAYIEQFLDELKKKDLDLLLCPALGMPACKPEHAGRTLATTAYVTLFNLLNFPAGVVPVTMVTEEDDRLLDDWIGYGNDPIDKVIKKTTKGAVGLPVSVQCVALPWQEEKCLRLMKEVETLCPV